MTTPPITRPSLSRTCLPTTGPITDAHLSQLFAPIPLIEPADLSDFTCVIWTWRIILSISAGLFGVLCWGIYQLIF